jgi:hypothetical protein
MMIATMKCVNYDAIDTWTRQQARPSIPIVTYARPIDERW